MRVLVIDDEPDLRDALTVSLQYDGYEVICAKNGAEGLRMASQCQPDIIVLDVLMPRLDGWETCQRLRETSDVPILFLSRLGGEEDVVRGLDCGGDDYLAKPYGLRELPARLEALLRRTRVGIGDSFPQLRYDDGVLTVDLRESVVRKRGQQISLSPKEWQLLACLVKRAGHVVSHRELLLEVWGPEYEAETSYLSLYVWYLRQKLEDDPRNPQYIHTRHRIGYCFSGVDSTD